MEHYSDIHRIQHLASGHPLVAEVEKHNPAVPDANAASGTALLKYQRCIMCHKLKPLTHYPRCIICHYQRPQLLADAPDTEASAPAACALAASGQPSPATLEDPEQASDPLVDALINPTEIHPPTAWPSTNEVHRGQNMEHYSNTHRIELLARWHPGLGPEGASPPEDWRNLPAYVFKGHVSSEGDLTPPPSLRASSQESPSAASEQDDTEAVEAQAAEGDDSPAASGAPSASASCAPSFVRDFNDGDDR